MIAHLTRFGICPTQRKLELVGRVPGLLPEQTIQLQDGEYLNLGSDADREGAEERKLARVLAGDPTATYRTIEKFIGIHKDRIKRVAESIGWFQEDGVWVKRKPS